MRYAAHILVLGALVLSGTISNAKADDQTHPAVPQAQMAVPKDNPVNENSKDRKPDQSAEAPNQSPAVIAPPATGDQNIIPPPTGGAESRMPIIPPPGTPGGNQDVKPQ